ncbi:MAG TPA: tetratricopeptide repeat protein, partial [Chthoniobacterales bacterium]
AMAAQRAYAVDPASLDACRTLAAIAERQKSPEAIDWRRRAVALAPDSLSDRVALAEVALRAGQPAIAADALEKVPAAKQNDVRYQSTAGHLAIVQQDFATADQHLAAAARLAPNDSERQLELAEFQLRSDDREKRDEGRAAAERLKNNPKVRLAALHILVNDALRWRHDSASAALAKELDGFPDAPFADRLLALGILRDLRDPLFSGALTRLEAESAKSAEKAVALINWMSGRELSLLAIDWSKHLPTEMLSDIPLRFALAGACMQIGDWAALKKMVEGPSWGRAEFLRLALQARVDSETGDRIGAERIWINAVAKAENDPARLNLLQTIAFQWKWPQRATGVLWMLAEIPDAQREALQTLYRHYVVVRDTTGLYRTLTRLVAIIPDDPAVRNNFAQVSLLIRAETIRARELAHQLHQQHPRNAGFASTYAFALFQDGDIKGALKVMSQLTPDQLKDPSVAAYYGIFLSSAGQTDEAAHYLELGEKAQLLPEEETLVARARAPLARQ